VRKRFFALAVVLSLFALTATLSAADTGRYRVYIGTYTGKDSKGIYRFDFDPATGKVDNLDLAAEVSNPSFLAIHPTKKYLYAIGEVNNFKGAKGGVVSAFAIDAKTGDLKLLNQQSTVGTGPCHLNVDATGKTVVVANYGGGSVASFPIDPATGKLGEAASFIQHKGSSINKGNQEAPHAHSANISSDNKFAIIADLGVDKLFIYKIDPEKGTLATSDPAFVTVKPGSGPRHFTFHPSGKYAYVINEIALTVTAFEYADGKFTEIQTISTVPEKKKGFSTAEVVVHPSGKFLYGSNRGHNSIAIFAIDPDTGKLTAKGVQGAGIKTPRNFAIGPMGKYLFVANQDGESVILFKIDQETGALEPTETSLKIGHPVCVRFVPIKE
jgi:6-phosphogluconolactonase